ncbi:MAG: thermonuclease family protein [Planctomycetaceae bacterium]|jgi:micrococcal nuclease|nr:thermonuclease family protein [Planctomycetaceae bacterium]
MKRKTPKNRLTRLLPKRYWTALAVFVLLAVLGFINPQWRQTAEKIISGKNAVDLNGEMSPSVFAADSALPSKKRSPLKVGIWRVVHIADGDTFDVIDGTQTKYRIRLIGSNTPETVKPNSPVEPYGPEASAMTKKMIAASNNRVRIAYDGDQIDRYGRTLAFVYLQLSTGEVCLNELLLREGLARAQLQYRFSPAAKERLRQAENEAKRSHKNIWSGR